MARVQSDYAWPTLLLGALALLSIAADWFQHRRKKDGEVNIMRWPLITILSLIAAAFCLAGWLKGG